LLHAALADTTIPFVFTREPGGTPLGEKIRELLIDPLGQMSRETESLLLNASRAELVDKVIEPALREGRLVVCDRFWDATVAYQGYGRGLPIEPLMSITMYAARGLCPDLTFLLDVPLEVSRQRLRGRSADRLEGEGAAFFERVAHGYHKLVAAQPQRFVVLDGQGSEEELAVQVRTTVLSRWRG
jgi:dTMP kinase